RRHYVAALRQKEGVLLQIGAALVVGCFFAGESVGYRAIMLLLTLPGLLSLDRPGVPHRLRLLSRSTIISILLVMYRLVTIGFLDRHALNVANSALAALIWIAYELIWWWIVAVLSALLTCYILESAAWR